MKIGKLIDKLFEAFRDCAPLDYSGIHDMLTECDIVEAQTDDEIKKCREECGDDGCQSIELWCEEGDCYQLTDEARRLIEADK